MITQIKANAIFEKVGFMLDERYAIATQLFMNCMFYAAVFPFGVLITIIGMTITFWSSKWWLLNYCSLPKFSFRIGRNIVILIIFRTTYLVCFLVCMPLDMPQICICSTSKMLSSIKHILSILPLLQFLYLSSFFSLAKKSLSIGS